MRAGKLAVSHVCLQEASCVSIVMPTGARAGRLTECKHLSRAALEYLKVAGAQPHILHVHEWQTSAVPMLYWEAYYGRGLSHARVVLTIHCLDNPGECREDEFAVTGEQGWC